MEGNAKRANPAGTYVLVHGGNISTDIWNKLAESNDYPPGGQLAGKIWDTIAPALEARNYHVLAPDLKDGHQKPNSYEY